MSGGSYDYLCFAESTDIFSKLSSLQSMADRLNEVCPEAAAETRALFDGPGSLLAELENRMARLKDIWHDVEWRDSADYGEEQLVVAVAKFKAKSPLSDVMQTEVARMRLIDMLLSQATRAISEAERIATRPRAATPGTPGGAA